MWDAKIEKNEQPHYKKIYVVQQYVYVHKVTVIFINLLAFFLGGGGGGAFIENKKEVQQRKQFLRYTVVYNGKQSVKQNYIYVKNSNKEDKII